ncbi:metallophosphoesterase family protein [candidate division KSB1 bacterium]|nr:metallophosphoesterase family protein [candidate division KSB1 bacterium]
MKLAIISDIHGNLEALQTALDLIKEEGLTGVICLGDLVGYGANPNECIEAVRDLTPHVIAGNHDWAVCGKSDISYFNVYAREAVLRHQGMVTPENMEYLKNLPLKIERDDCLFVHSTPEEPEQWNYIFSPMEAERQFGYFTQKVCFIGHSHHPGIFSLGTRRIINVGSVGQPRDGNPELCFGVYDNERDDFSFRRSEYDNQLAAEKIRRAGLPGFLADRLLVGR